MCGICGVIHRHNQPVDHTLLQAMNDSLTHRGPDGDGYVINHDERLSVGLAMRRLSIIDIAGSDQPLYNETRRISMVFNGEIFNYHDLRADLIQRGHRFNTGGDGETIVHLYETYGLDAPKYLRGQFAFALWDADEQRLLMARDRTGQKPLYYYHDERVLVFASEIKALLMHPDVPRRAIFDQNPDQLALYLGYGYMPAPHTAFEHIHALLPGHVLVWQGGALTTHPYWTPPPINPARHNTAQPIAPYVEQVRDALTEAVRLRLIADVPLGAFLSGGLDSSLIVGLMQQLTNTTVKTFSMGFAGDSSYDETPYAEQVAQHLQTEHTAFTVQPDALALLPKLVWHHDQPFADSSAIPTYLVSDLTRQHVTVALTGDGGDELFAGYERFYAAHLVRQLGFLPRGLWQLASRALNALPEHTGYYNRIKRAGRFARAASLPIANAYFDWVRLFDAGYIHALTQQPDHAGHHFAALFTTEATPPAILSANFKTYLPDDLLIKADRCSMAASLEARAPFLDHILIEQVAPLPFDLKLKRNITKYILKEAARGLLPDTIIDRKKHGFGVPLGAWLRHDMSLVQETLQSQTAQTRGILQPQAVQRLIEEHQSGQRDHGQRLWTLLTLEWWYRLFIDPPRIAPPDQ